jgi:hypothetical protein
MNRGEDYVYPSFFAIGRRSSSSPMPQSGIGIWGGGMSEFQVAPLCCV